MISHVWRTVSSSLPCCVCAATTGCSMNMTGSRLLCRNTPNSRCAGSPRFRFARAQGALRFAPHPLRRASLPRAQTSACSAARCAAAPATVFASPPLSAPGLLRVLRVASLRSARSVALCAVP